MTAGARYVGRPLVVTVANHAGESIGDSVSILSSTSSCARRRDVS